MGFLSSIFGDPPQPPNPIVTAGAQTAQNIGTGITTSYLNNYNQQTPAGNLTYEPTSTYNYVDPLTGQNYAVPRWTATQTYTPTGQATFEANQQTGYNLATLGTQSSERLSGLLGSSFNPTFNASAYLQENPDVLRYAQENGIDPLALAASHYQNYGMVEGRTSGGVPSLSSLEGFDPVSSFGGVDPNEYLRQNPDVLRYAQENGIDPAQFAGWHYQNFGTLEGRTGGLVGTQQRSITDPGQQQSWFGDAGDITRSYGPEDDFSSDRARVEASLFQRMDPQLQQDRARLIQQLADQGIRYGSKAYDDAIAMADRQTTDARLAVTAAGGQEQQRMMDMEAQRAGFQNAAQKQAYDQALGRGTFANQSLMEQFQKNLNAGTFANAAQKDAFTQDASRAQFYNASQAQQLAAAKARYDAANAQRDQYIQEQYALRAQPINEISALQSGSQVSQPNFVSGGNSQIANTDIAGIVNANFGQQLDIYKQNSSNLNNIIGGMFGLASAGVKAAPTSDRRAKKNIAKLGNVYMADRHDTPKKLPIYAYEYKDGHEDDGARRHIGPMAQDVERINPKAVTTRKGVKHIYPRKIMGDILKVA